MKLGEETLENEIMKSFESHQSKTPFTANVMTLQMCRERPLFAHWLAAQWHIDLAGRFLTWPPEITTSWGNNILRLHQTSGLKQWPGVRLKYETCTFHHIYKVINACVCVINEARRRSGVNNPSWVNTHCWRVKCFSLWRKLELS